MQFQNAIITNEGVRIFQAALDNNPVVFTKCLFSGSSTPLTGSMTALPEPTWGNGHVTNYAANDNGGDFIIYASATNATDYGYAYGYGIYGYLQNEGIEHETLLIVANYDGNVTYVSEASGPYARFHFAITIKLSMAAGVLSIAPHYNDLVSDAAFQDLANRTVTTHTAVDPNAGDAQIVRGQKHFYDTTYFGGDSNAPFIEIASDVETGSMYLNAEHESQQIRVQMKPKDYGDDSNNNVYVNSNISPSGDGVVSLGTNGYRWLELNCYYVWASDTIGVSNQYGSTGMRAEGIEFLNAEGDSVGGIGLHNDTQLLIDGNGQPVHIASLTVDDNATVTGNLNVNGTIATETVVLGGARLTGNAYYVAIDKTLNVTGDATVSGQAMIGSRATIGVLGTSPYYVGTYQGELRVGTTLNDGAINGGSFRATTMNATTMNATTVNATTVNINGGSATLDAIAFNAGFTYPHPVQGNLDHMPIGSLFLAYIEAPQTTIYPGEFIRNNGVTTLYVAAIDSSGNVDFGYSQRVAIPVTPSNTFQVLNVVPTTGGIALVLRVA